MIDIIKFVLFKSSFKVVVPNVICFIEHHYRGMLSALVMSGTIPLSSITTCSSCFWVWI